MTRGVVIEKSAGPAEGQRATHWLITTLQYYYIIKITLPLSDHDTWPCLLSLSSGSLNSQFTNLKIRSAFPHLPPLCFFQLLAFSFSDSKQTAHSLDYYFFLSLAMILFTIKFLGGLCFSIVNYYYFFNLMAYEKDWFVCLGGSLV